MNNSPQLFDRNQAIARLGNDEELLNDVISVFLEACPEYVQQIEAAIANQDWPLVEKGAHKIKGAASNVASDIVREYAVSTEEAARQKDPQAISSQFSALKEKIQALQEILMKNE